MKTKHKLLLFLLAAIFPLSAMAIPHCSRDMDKSDTVATYQELRHLWDKWLDVSDGHLQAITDSCSHNSACVEKNKPIGRELATSQIGYGIDEISYEMNRCKKVLKNKHKMTDAEIAN